MERPAIQPATVEPLPLRPRFDPGLSLVHGAAVAPVGDVLDAMDELTRGLLHGRQRATLPRRGWLVRRALTAADLAGLCAAYAITFAVYGPGQRLGASSEALAFALTLPAWIAVAKLHGLYGRDETRADNSTSDDVVGVFHLVTIGAWLLVAASYVTGLARPDLPRVVLLWGLAIVIVPLARACARATYRRSSAYLQNTIIVGAGDIGQLVARKLVKHPEYGINLVGFVDEHPKDRRADLPERLTILGSAADLPALVDRLDVERVIVSFSFATDAEVLDLVRALRDLNVQIDLVPRLFEVMGPNVGIHTVEALPLVGLPPVRLSPSSRLFKRAVDVAGASLALVATAPLFAFIAWRVARTSPGPILFRQTRLGHQMREFTALKFRTMRTGTDDDVHRDYIRRTMSASAAAEAASGVYKLDRGDAVTPTGRWLRKTSLDELPQLLNVLRGEMSLVGPRPCIPYETEHFRAHHFERFLVPQGITGLWQVTARANSSFGEALDMDVAYARGWSLGLDLRLILRTPLQLLRQRGATA